GARVVPHPPSPLWGGAWAGGAPMGARPGGGGGGKSDAFQAGVYGATKSAPAYLAAAFAFANHWMSTDRTAVFDHLSANFNAQSYGGRLESGYRFPTIYRGITPHAPAPAPKLPTPGSNPPDTIAHGFEP